MLRSRYGVLVSLAATCFLGGGCGDKKKEVKSDPPASAEVLAVEGLDAIPASATAVVGIDVAKLSQSDLVLRAIERMFAGDKTLEADISSVLTACQFDMKSDLHFATIAIVPRQEKGLDDSLLVAKGNFNESAISACLGRFLEEKGGKLEISETSGRRIYHEVSPDRREQSGRWLAFGSSDTLLVSSGQALLLLALGEGEKLSGNAGVLSPYLPKAKLDSGIWAVYQFDEIVAQGLIKASQGQLGPAQAAVAYADVGKGLSTRIQVEMASESDAKALISLVKAQLTAAAMIFQLDSAGRLIQKIEGSSTGAWANLTWSLSEQELADLLGSNLLGNGSTIDIQEKKNENPALAPALVPGPERDTNHGKQHTDPDSKKEL